jgi:hypothetical protein
MEIPSAMEIVLVGVASIFKGLHMAGILDIR